MRAGDLPERPGIRIITHEVKEMLIEKVHGGTYSQCRIPGLVITGKGTLLAYYECRRSHSDWAEIDLKVIRSTDEGETWQTVSLICGNGNTLNNPVMFVKGEQVHLLFLKNYRQLYHAVSTDDGNSFSEPEEKTVECPFFFSVMAVGPGHGILRGERMIVPVWFAQNREDPKAHHPSVLATLYSDDGESWQVGEIIGRDRLRDPSECALANTKDGRVLISIRHENNCRRRAFAVSADGTGDWKELRFHSRIPDPICMGSMCEQDGRIWHINCDSVDARENLTVRVSEDCFESFESIFVDTPGGYSDIAVKDDTLYVFYERDCNEGGLYFKKIRLQESRGEQC